MDRLAILLTSIILLSISGCARSPAMDRHSPESIERFITFEYDPYTKTRKITGPNGNIDSDPRGGTVFLRATLNPEGEFQALQIYGVYRYYGEWAFLDRATDINGNKMRFVSISREVVNCSRLSGCLFAEHFALNISTDYLLNSQKNGISFRAYGKAGQKEFRLSPAYITAFINEIERRTNH